MANQRNNNTPIVHAPYNFVPYNTSFLPISWRKKTAIDVPLEQGLCGEISVSLRTHSPLMIGEPTNTAEPVRFFSVEGTPVIPGSSIRGMLRNVTEVISFSKFQYVNDRYPTMRDIRDRHYKSHLNKNDKLAVKAGWLSFDNKTNSYAIIACDYARVSYKLLNEWCRSSSFKNQEEVDKKYRLAGGLAKTFKFDKASRDSRGGEAIATQGSDYQGRLVFTGHGKNKEAEYIFFNEADAGEPVSEAVIRAFLAIYDKDAGEKSPLKKLKKVVKEADGAVPGIPVFFVRGEHGDIEILGLTAMMKIPPQHSVHDLLPEYTGLFDKGINIDMTENLFGRIADDNIAGSYSLKSRLSFADLRCRTGELASSPVEVLLGQPKASFFPSYLEQSDSNKQSQLTQRQTNFHAGDRPRLRGFKRYPVQTNVPLQPPMPHLKSGDNNQNVRTSIIPMLEGAEFHGKIRFHNVTPKELGLLLWAITWGNDASLHHSLGMAKPYGYGNVSFEIEKLEMEKNSEPGNWHDATDTVADHIEQIEQLLTQATKEKWDTSDRMKELIAMAKGIPADSAEIQYMKLEDHAGAKANDSKSNASKGHALAAFSHLTDRA